MGLCEDYPEESRTLAAARADLAVARDAGAKVLRIAFGWDAMEPERGKYDWSFWDDFVREAHATGVELIPYVCYTPKWAAEDQGENFWRSPPRDPADFGRFVSAVVARYRGTIRSWELWNEPDNKAYWLGTSAQFADLVRAGSAAVRAADPKAAIVLGGIATELDFLETLFREHRLAPAVDIVNLHTYFETWHPDPIERLAGYVDDAAEIVRVHGENEPLWLAEAGYSSVGGRAAVSDVYRARYRGEHTDDAQADALTRIVVVALAAAKLPVIAWYRINDLPPVQEVIGDDNNRHLGVRRADGTPKPALAAFCWTAGLFAQPYRIVRCEILSEAGGVGEPQVYGFALRDGRHVIAAWLAMPDADQTVPSEPVEDPRRGTLRVRLPGVRAESVQLFDAQGRSAGAQSVAARASADGVEFPLALRGGALRWCVIRSRDDAGKQ